MFFVNTNKSFFRTSPIVVIFKLSTTSFDNMLLIFLADFLVVSL